MVLIKYDSVFKLLGSHCRLIPCFEEFLKNFRGEDSLMSTFLETFVQVLQECYPLKIVYTDILSMLYTTVDVVF